MQPSDMRISKLKSRAAIVHVTIAQKPPPGSSPGLT